MLEKIKLLLAITLTAAVIIACKDNEHTDPPPSYSIIGEWTTDFSSTVVDNFIYVFNSDGTWHWTGMQPDENHTQESPSLYLREQGGTWQHAGNALRIWIEYDNSANDAPSSLPFETMMAYRLGNKDGKDYLDLINQPDDGVFVRYYRK